MKGGAPPYARTSLLATQPNGGYAPVAPLLYSSSTGSEFSILKNISFAVLLTV